MSDRCQDRSILPRASQALLVIACVLCLTAPSGASETAIETADYVLRNGRVVTIDPALGVQQAVAVKANRFVAVGTDEEIGRLIGSRTRVIELSGKTVIPGLIDSHLHATFGAANEFAVSLNGVDSIADLQARIARRVEEVRRDEWIATSGDWHESQIKEGRLPTRREIDAVAPDNPVFIPRGGHVAVANSRALALARLDKNTPDPEDGVIVRDGTGEPTGVLIEGSATTLVKRLIPTLTQEQRVSGLERYTTKLLRAGITSIVDPGMSPPELAAYAELRRRGRLKLRVSALLFSRTLADMQRLAPTIASFTNDDWLRVAGFKMGLDGGIEAAYLSSPYRIVAGEQEDPAFVGKLLLPPGGTAEFENMLAFAGSRKLQIQVHVVGDAALDHLLAAVSKVEGKVSPRELRWVAVHTFLPTSHAIARISQLGMHVSVQDQPVTLGHNMRRYWGEARAARAIPIRSMLAAGIPVGGGTDAPIVDPSPFVSLWWMVTRGTLPNGDVLGADEAITREQALRIYTMGSAGIQHTEDRIGSVSPGKLADLVVLSEDPLKVPADRIRHIRSVLTMTDGRIAHNTLE